MLVSLILVTSGAVMGQDQIQKKDRIHQEDHLQMQDGSCLLVKDGVPTKLQTQLKLNNGSVVNPDGSYQLQNQKKYQLRNGEYLDMNCNRYLNQNQYNKKAMMSNKQIESVRIKAINQNGSVNQVGQKRGRN
jgi:hypothetical protein